LFGILGGGDFLDFFSKTLGPIEKFFGEGEGTNPPIPPPPGFTSDV